MLVYHDGHAPAFSEGIIIANNLSELVKWYISNGLQKHTDDSFEGSKMEHGIFYSTDNNNCYYLSDVLNIYKNDDEIDLSNIEKVNNSFDTDRIKLISNI